MTVWGILLVLVGPMSWKKNKFYKLKLVSNSYQIKTPFYTHTCVQNMDRSWVQHSGHVMLVGALSVCAMARRHCLHAKLTSPTHTPPQTLQPTGKQKYNMPRQKFTKLLSYLRGTSWTTFSPAWSFWTAVERVKNTEKMNKTLSCSGIGHPSISNMARK